jgi:hypothetical protein
MALIIPPGYAQATIPFRHASLAREAVITFGLDISDAAGDYESVAEMVMQEYADSFGTILDSDVTAGGVRLRIGQDGGDPLTYEGSDTFAAGAGGASLPSNCAVLFKKTSSTGGRKGRGRFYLPWSCADSGVNDVGQIEPTDVPEFQTLANTFLNGLATGPPSSPMVILHDSGSVGVEPPPSVVTALTVDPMIATQRRRLGR